MHVLLFLLSWALYKPARSSALAPLPQHIFLAMQITAISLLFASLISASPVFKRQDTSSAVEAASSVVESIVETASSSAAAPSASSSSGASDYGAGLLVALRERDATTVSF